MITTADFRNGLNIELDGQVYTIVWFQHHKPGKGGALMRTKLKNVETGQVLEKTFRAGEKINEAVVEKRKAQYLYRQGEEYIFMDMENYEQVPFNTEILGEAVKFLKENIEVFVLWYKERVIGIELPATVELKVTFTTPGLRGDTVTNVMKPATLETGAEVAVPLFITTGETVKIDTRTGEYVERS